MVGVTQQEYEQGQFEERGNLQDGDDGPLQQWPMRKQAPQDGDTEWRNPATGKLQRIPQGIDPGRGPLRLIVQHPLYIHQVIGAVLLPVTLFALHQPLQLSRCDLLCAGLADQNQ